MFDFAPLSGDRERVQWAAMYGDCLHEVKEVKKGYRVTLTFSIIQEGKAAKTDERTWNSRPVKYARARDNLAETGYKVTCSSSSATYDYPEIEVRHLILYQQ